MGCCEDCLTCDIAFNAVMSLSRASTRGRYSRIVGVTYPHRFEAVLSVQGYHGHFACRDFTGGGSFRAHCNFGIARRGLRWRELLEHNETKIYLKYFGLTRRGLKFPDKPNVYCTKSIRTTNVIQNFEFMLCSIKIFRYVYNACNLVLK